MTTIKVFTDGSFKKVKNKIYCGYGIFFPNGELSNVSRPFIHKPLTNPRAELYAILKTLRNLIKNNIEINKVIIYTDSKYSIKSLTVWYKSWEENNWKKSQGKPVMNQDIIRPIIKIIKKYDGKINFQHIRSHTGKQDFESLSNEMADKLANEGALKPILK